MSFKCGFFNAVNGDRKYNADDMNKPYSRIVSNGVFGKPNGEQSDDFKVVAGDNLSVVVKKGQGIFAGRWAELDEEMTLGVTTPHLTLSRIDSIIVRMNNGKDVRNGSVEYLTGTPNNTPQPPILTNTNDIKEYRLCNIYINPNATTIDNANIEDTRATSECGFIHNLLWNADITAFMSNWKAQFNDWFNNIKASINTGTAVNLLTSQYIVPDDGTADTVIPINISAFKGVLDYLQVYINGLLETEYTVSDDRQTITLSKPLKTGTVVDFVCYTSLDGTKAESVVDTVIKMSDDLDKINQQSTVLWQGNGAGTIQPNKKLSDTLNGYLLMAEKTDGTGFTTAIIPKLLPNGDKWNGQGFYIGSDKIAVRDNQLVVLTNNEYIIKLIKEI